MTPGSGGDTACHSTSGHTAALTYKTYHITIITCSYCIAYCILWPPIDLTWYCTINVEQAHYTEEVIAEVDVTRAAGGQEAGVTGWVLPDDYWWSHVAAHCWAGSLVCSLKLPGCQRTHYCQHSGGGRGLHQARLPARARAVATTSLQQQHTPATHDLTLPAALPSAQPSQPLQGPDNEHRPQSVL